MGETHNTAEQYDDAELTERSAVRRDAPFQKRFSPAVNGCMLLPSEISDFYKNRREYDYQSE